MAAEPGLLSARLALGWLIGGEWRFHPARFLTTAVAIAVGVALGFAVHLVNGSALASFEAAVTGVNGAADLQVTAGKNLSALHKGLKSSGNRRVTVQKLPGVNHLFQSDPTQWPLFDGQPKAAFSPEALKVMHGWIAQQVVIIKPEAVPITVKRAAPTPAKPAAKKARS